MWPLIPPAVLSAEEQSTCKGFIDSVASELWKLQPPPNCEHNPWTGPFDQLVSCAYALMQAENRGFHARPTDNYFEDVLAKIVELLREQKAEASESDALNNYLSSFYFNAGIQRLTFAAERLLAAFVGVYCICGKEPMIVGNRT